MKKRTIAAITLAAGFMLVGCNAPEAHADPSVTTMGDDSYVATCNVLAKDLDGIVNDDAGTLLGVAGAIASYYHVGLTTAAMVVNYQVQTYCPSQWPYLVAVGNAARGPQGVYT